MTSLLPSLYDQTAAAVLSVLRFGTVALLVCFAVFVLAKIATMGIVSGLRASASKKASPPHFNQES